jgi:hypothetical protein
MSENPFKIIRPSDEPPAHLKKEVMGSVKLLMLMMRFMQLFTADFSMALFEKFRLVGGTDEKQVDKDDPSLDR